MSRKNQSAGEKALRAQIQRDREQEYQDIQVELARRRFLHPLQRGIGVGRKDGLDYSGNEDGDGHTINAYQGSATVWFTLDVNENKQYREWPDGWSGPGRICSHIGFESWAIPLAQAREIVERKVQETNALRLAEGGDGELSMVGKSITRVEAVLAEQFDECYHEAVTFCMASDLLEEEKGNVNPNARSTWAHEEQAKGKQLFNTLQKAYGEKHFPSAEAVSMAAEWLRLNWRRARQHFESKPGNFDRYLYLATQKLWKAKGPPSTRNVIAEVPLREGRNIIKLRQKAFDDCPTICKSIITTFEQIGLLHHVSPIANAALYGTPKVIDNAPVNQEVQPLLINVAARPYPGPQFNDWLSVFYNKKGGRYIQKFVQPLSVGPHKIISNVDQHEECAALLRELADNLAAHSHWILVVAVWRDYLIHFAENDDVESINEFGGMLLAMIEGLAPSSIQGADGDVVEKPMVDKAKKGRLLHFDEVEEAVWDAAVKAKGIVRLPSLIGTHARTAALAEDAADAAEEDDDDML